MKLFLIGNNGEMKNVNPVRETRRSAVSRRKEDSSTLRDEIRLMLCLALSHTKEENSAVTQDTDILSEKCA